MLNLLKTLFEEQDNGILKKQSELTPSNTERSILLIDCSGSMNYKDWQPKNRLGAAKIASIEFVRRKQELDKQDEIGIVSFSGMSSTALAPCGVGPYYARIIAAIEKLKAEDSTNIAAGLKTAAEIFMRARRFASARERIILLSDGGQTDPGNPVMAAQQLKQAGCIIDCIGIGPKNEVDEKLLKKIASVVQGVIRYRWIGETETLIRHFGNLSSKLVLEKK